MLQRKIGMSEKVDVLWQRAGAEAALLWTWMVAWWDVHGNMRGSPMWLMSNVVPRAAERECYTIASINAAVDVMVELGLVVRYEADRIKCLHCPGFKAEQIHLRPDRESRDVPPFPGAEAAPAKVPTQQRVKQRRAAAPPSSAADVEIDAAAEFSIAQLMEIGRDLPDAWWEAHPSKRQVVAWWIDGLELGGHERPPNGAIHRQGKVADRLGKKYTRHELARAVVGITRIFPHAAPTVVPKSPHRSWDLMDLEKRFVAAHGAPMPWDSEQALEDRLREADGD